MSWLPLLAYLGVFVIGFSAGALAMGQRQPAALRRSYQKGRAAGTKETLTMVDAAAQGAIHEGLAKALAELRDTPATELES